MICRSNKTSVKKGGCKQRGACEKKISNDKKVQIDGESLKDRV